MSAAAQVEPACYVYGICSDRPLDVRDVEGVGPGPGAVDLVAHGGLAAIVTPVPFDYVEGRRRDMLAHAAVLERIAHDRTVLPMRFGMVLPGHGEVVHDVLEVHHERLRHLLDSLEGCVEVDVRALYDEDSIIRQVVDDDPRLGRLAQRVGSRGATDDNIRLGEAIAGAVARRREHDAAVIVERLSAIARDVAVGTQTTDLMVVNAAVLVDRGAAETVDRTAAELAEQWGGVVRFRITGPMPPYSFADLPLGQG